MENEERLEHIIAKMKAILSYLDSVKYAAPGSEQNMGAWLNGEPNFYQENIDSAKDSLVDALAYVVDAKASLK